MGTSRKSWRNSRNTISGQRHQRRMRRRHIKRGGTYYPMVSDTSIATSGIRKQLILATLSVTSALACFVLCISATQFMFLVCLGMGLVALGFGVALIASARREETLHLDFDNVGRLGHEEASNPSADESQESQSSTTGSDGTL